MFYRKQSLVPLRRCITQRTTLHMSKMTSNPALTERNTQKAKAYLLHYIRRVSHSTELVRMCLACQHFDFNSADWISDNLHVISR